MKDYTRSQCRLAGLPQDNETSTDYLKPSVTTGMTTQVLHTPKVFAFSGEGDNKETTYEAWKYEILTLLPEGLYSVQTITTVVKKYLRREIAKV